MNKVPLTVAGAEKLRQELQRLKTVDRPNVIAAIAEARSHGDLSENAEYDAAKERQGFIEGRIKEIEGKLSNAQIIDPKLLDADGSVIYDLYQEFGVTKKSIGIAFDRFMRGFSGEDKTATSQLLNTTPLIVDKTASTQ